MIMERPASQQLAQLERGKVDLCERERDGVKVILYRNFGTMICSIWLEDLRRNTAVEWMVADEVALDAYYHPYVYAPEGLIVDTPNE